MESFSVIIMRKDDSNILSEEVASFEPKENDVYIDSVFSVLENGRDLVHLRLSTNRDVEEWEFSAIFDYYDMERLESFGFVESVVDKDDSFNPIWEVRFFLPDTKEMLDEYVGEILQAHGLELEQVYDEIKDKEEEYR